MHIITRPKLREAKSDIKKRETIKIKNVRTKRVDITNDIIGTKENYTGLT